MLLLQCALFAAVGQEHVTDSIKRLLVLTQQDTKRVLLLSELAGTYQFFNSDTAIVLAQQAIALAQKLQFSKGESRALTRLGEVMRVRGEFPQALEANLKGLRLSRQTNNIEEEANTLSFTAHIYIDLGEYRQGLNYLLLAKKIYEVFLNNCLHMVIRT